MWDDSSKPIIASYYPDRPWANQAVVSCGGYRIPEPAVPLWLKNI